MFNGLSTYIQEKVAREEAKGYTFEKFWSLIEEWIKDKACQLQSSTPVTFNTKYREYIWNSIKCDMNMLYTKNDHPIDINVLTIQDMLAQKKEIVVCTDKDTQKYYIEDGLDIDQYNLPDLTRQILRLIIQRKHEGVLQMDLRDQFSLNNKTIFPIIKRLSDEKLIVKMYLPKNKCRACILYFKDYAPKLNSGEKTPLDSDEMYFDENIKRRIEEELKKADNETMTVSDLADILGFKDRKQRAWIFRQLVSLHKSGFLHRFLAYDGRISKVCVKLKRQPEDNNSDNTVEDIKDLYEVIGLKELVVDYYRDLPIDYQIYQYINSSKGKGVTRVEIMNRFPLETLRRTSQYFNNFLNKDKSTYTEYLPFGIFQVEEIQGKVRQNRFYGLDGWEEIHEKVGKDIPMTMNYVNWTVECKEPSQFDSDAKDTNAIPTTSKKEQKKKAMDEDTNENVRKKPEKKRQRNEKTNMSNSDDHKPKRQRTKAMLKDSNTSNNDHPKPRRQKKKAVLEDTNATDNDHPKPTGQKKKTVLEDTNTIDNDHPKLKRQRTKIIPEDINVTHNDHPKPTGPSTNVVLEDTNATDNDHPKPARQSTKAVLEDTNTSDNDHPKPTRRRKSDVFEDSNANDNGHPKLKRQRTKAALEDANASDNGHPKPRSQKEKSVYTNQLESDVDYVKPEEQENMGDESESNYVSPEIEDTSTNYPRTRGQKAIAEATHSKLRRQRKQVVYTDTYEGYNFSSESDSEPKKQKDTAFQAQLFRIEEGSTTDSLKRKNEELNVDGIGDTTSEDVSQSKKIKTTSNDSQTTDVKVTKPKKPEKPKGKVNATRLERKQVILDMIEERRVIEYNTQFTNEVNCRIMKLQGKGIARSTMVSLIERMHTDRELIYYVCTHGNFGLTSIKKFLIHRTLSIECDELKKLLQKNTFQKLIFSQQKKAPMEVVSVDSLPSIRTPKVDKPESKEPPVIVNTEDSLAVNDVAMDKENLKIDYENIDLRGLFSSDKDNWLSIAIKAGFDYSKWLRAKKLHKLMFETYLKKHNKDKLEDSDNVIIDMMDFIKQISLHNLIRMHGSLPFENPQFRQYIESEDNMNTSIENLPEDIRNIIGHLHRRFRNTFRSLLSLLKSIDLIESLTSNDQSDVSEKYLLRKTGIIRDFRKITGPALMTFPLTSLQEVKVYWKELRDFCTDVKQTKDNDIQNKDVKNIMSYRAWSGSRVISTEDRKILDAHVDFENRVVPVDDNLLVIHLGKVTNLKCSQIRRYFQDLEHAFKFPVIPKKVKLSAEEKDRRLMEGASPEIRALIQAAVEKRKVGQSLKELKQLSPFVEKTFIGSRRYRRLRVRVLQQKPEQTKGNYSTFHRKRTKPFSQIEYDLLVFAYVIMNVRSENLQFLWNPITQVLPNMNRELCRRKFHNMLGMYPVLRETVEELKELWRKFYKQGLELGELKDDQPWNTKEYDLKSYTEYFITKLDKEGYIYNNFKLNNPRLEGLNVKSLKRASTQQIAFRYMNKFNLPAGIDVYDVQNVLMLVASQAIKISCMIQEENYNSAEAYCFLKQFPDKILKKAYEMLKKEGVLVNDRYSRVPGRLINISEKFINSARGKLPYQLLDHALESYEQLLKGDSIRVCYGGHIKDGMMAAVLDLLSQGKIDLTLRNKARWMRERCIMKVYPSRKLTNKYSALVQKIDIQIRKKPSFVSNKIAFSPSSIQYNGKMHTSDYNQIDEHIKTLDREHNGISQVYQAIKSQGKSGVLSTRLTKLIQKTKGIQMDEDKVIKYCDILISHHPPLIQMVGFNQLRYVSYQYLKHWYLKSNQENSYFEPVIWNDYNGNIIPEALRGCADTVISYIVQSPGISYSSLFKKMSSFLKPLELHRILRYLLDSNTLYSKTFKEIKKPSVFDRRKTTMQPPRKFIANNEITYYWLNPNYYVNDRVNDNS